MPPITRTSSLQRGVAKHVNRKACSAPRKQTADSWELLDSGRHNMREPTEEPEVEEEQRPATDGPANVNEAVSPLREMAERVGMEVERFAESLDKAIDEIATAGAYDAMHDMVLQFKRVANDHVYELQRSHDRERRRQLREEWSRQAQIASASVSAKTSTLTRPGLLGAQKAEQVRKLRRWQEEADTWDLMRIMMEIQDQPAAARQQEKEEGYKRLGNVNHYTTENELFERFLLDNDIAKERALIKNWLEQTADHRQSDLEGIMEELEEKAGTGAGIWSRGWMCTREKIKGEKRMRAWPSPDASPLPQIRRSDNNELLVTALDPDAPSRQNRQLEKQDAYFERSMWIACWEMLRRGKTWAEVSEWCEQRKEGWRAVSIGQGMHTTDAASSATWRKMCFLASQSGCSNEYEAAVYGLLGGSVDAVQNVCRTIDDHLFAYYNSIVSSHFNHYIQANFPQRLPQALRKPTYVNDARRDLEDSETAVFKLIQQLRTKSSTKDQTTEPLKIIQSYLLHNEMDSLVNGVGYAVSDLDKRLDQNERLMIVHLRDAPEEPRPECEVVLDPQALRITAHISLIMQAFRQGPLPTQEEQWADDNVIAAYVQALRAAGNRDSIPLYAARMSRGRSVFAASSVLQDITRSDEQAGFLTLMQSYDLDVEGILHESVVTALMELDGKRGTRGPPLNVLEPSEEDIHPGQRIKADYLPVVPDDATRFDQGVVSSLQWFQLWKGHWHSTFSELSKTLCHCLTRGHMACALEVVRMFPYEQVATTKSVQHLGRSLHTFQPHDDEEELMLEVMENQSKTYLHLEQLLHALQSLATWRAEEDKFTHMNPRPKSAPTALKRAFNAVDEAMQPLLQGILQDPVDEKEAHELSFIREAFVPDAILAYNAVLHSAAYLITRDHLLQSMDLSTIVAKEGNGLAQDFLQAGRMGELVRSFAKSSHAILILKGNREKEWKPKKNREGKDPGVWEIGPQGAGIGASVEASMG